MDQEGYLEAQDGGRMTVRAADADLQVSTALLRAEFRVSTVYTQNALGTFADRGGADTGDAFRVLRWCGFAAGGRGSLLGC